MGTISHMLDLHITEYSNSFMHRGSQVEDMDCTSGPQDEPMENQPQIARYNEPPHTKSGSFVAIHHACYFCYDRQSFETFLITFTSRGTISHMLNFHITEYSNSFMHRGSQVEDMDCTSGPQDEPMENQPQIARYNESSHQIWLICCNTLCMLFLL